jgi:hypothetical protein
MYGLNRIRKVHYLRLAMVAAVLQTAFVARSQELEPRAYSISPQGTNFLILGFTRLTGDVSFEPDLPTVPRCTPRHLDTYTRPASQAVRRALGWWCRMFGAQFKAWYTALFNKHSGPDWRIRPFGLRLTFTEGRR